MNLWARVSGPTILLAILFFGCEREDLTIGLPPKSNIFDVRYFEHVPAVSAFLRDTIPSYNVSRLLVGQYDDLDFGAVYAEGYAQLVPQQDQMGYFNSTDVLDSAVLVLVNDYVYGESVGDYQVVRIRSLGGYDSAARVNRFTSSQMTSIRDLGFAGFHVAPEGGNKWGDTVRVLLDHGYMSVVFDSLKKFEFDYSTDKFLQSFPGLAFVPYNNDAVLGINVNVSNSNLVFYYSTPGDTEGNSQELNFGSVRHNYIVPNQAENNRTGTSLEAITNYYTSFDLGDGLAYFQSGTGVRTTIDMSGLTQAGDTMTNYVINTAILEFSDLDNTIATMWPSLSIQMYLTDSTNRIKATSDFKTRKIYKGHKSDSLSVSQTPPNSLLGEELIFFEKDNALRADITMFVQNLMENKGDLMTIMLEDPKSGENISRFICRKENVKVKVYYTTRQ